MIVVRILLNSWATLEASVPTLERRCARRSCARRWSASEAVRVSSPIMSSPHEWCNAICFTHGIGSACSVTSSEVLVIQPVKNRRFQKQSVLHNGRGKKRIRCWGSWEKEKDGAKPQAASRCLRAPVCQADDLK